MKAILLSLGALLLLAGTVWGQKTAALQPGGTGLDTALARRVGADDYGMRKYTFVLLKRGPNKDTAKAARKLAFQGHFANMTRLSETGRLVLAGPYTDKTDWAGLFILATDKTAEAEEWVKTDPAVKAGYLSYELHAWMGSAAVMLIPELHEKVAKVKM